MTTPIEGAFNSIRERIKRALAKSPYQQTVTLLAVSKVQPLDSIRELYRLGQRDFAENYAQELVEKAQTLKQENFADIRWHFIGHLQTNKVKMILPYVYSIHSIDSFKLAQEISKRSPQDIRCFIEVNLNAEESKTGVPLAEVEELAAQIAALPRIKLSGLMSIPRAELSPNQLREAFDHLREKSRALSLPEISMGMSSDFEMAVEAGSTHVRVGTALFGARQKSK